MTNVSRTNRNGFRPGSDLYSTPYEASRPYVRHEMRAILRAANSNIVTIWEPAAGEGWLAHVFEEHGFATIETDRIIHRRKRKARVGKLNFFAARRCLAPIIITNPPYSEGNSGDRFVRHALMLGPRYAAFFLPITFLAGVSRQDLLEGVIGGCKLARVLTLGFRTTLKPRDVKLKNGGVVTYAWFVWERGHKGPSINIQLQRVSAPVELRRAA